MNCSGHELQSAFNEAYGNCTDFYLKARGTFHSGARRLTKTYMPTVSVEV